METLLGFPKTTHDESASLNIIFAPRQRRLLRFFRRLSCSNGTLSTAPDENRSQMAETWKMNIEAGIMR